MSNKPKILYIDDEPKNLSLMRQVLQDDYHVIVFPDGLKALEAINKINPDLILLDVMMLTVDGYEICTLLKESKETAEIPVIFVTAKSELEDEMQGLKMGAVDYIRKPIQKDLLKLRIKTQLELREKILMERKLSEMRADIERIARHDLKTPLNAILNFPMIIREDPLTDLQAELLDDIEMAGQTMLELINMSLDLYKMEQGKYQLKAVPVNILSVINNILHNNMFIDSIKRPVNIRINGQPVSSHSEFIVQGEELLFYSLLSNLLTNAFEASHGDQSIRIELNNTHEHFISIHNQGSVPVEIRDTFFEKYVTKGKEHGTGLGTYSAKLIAETLGGNISLQTSDETGTEMKIVF
jgi:signal transduction histidine kinase